MKNKGVSGSMEMKAFIFDMDGLIFDSERVEQRSWNIVGCEMGYGNIGEHIYNTLGMNVVSRKNYFLKHIDPKFPHEEFTARTRVVFREIVDSEGLAVKPGAKELIMLGKEKGYRLAVATSSRRDYASRLLKEAKVYDYFDGFVFGDMVSHSKPDPEIYEILLKRYKIVPEQALFFDDRPENVEGARKAGINGVVFNTDIPLQMLEK